MKDWLKANLPKENDPETEIPLIGQSVVLYCCPHDRSKAWTSDIGSVTVEKDGADIMWESAFGMCSAFDGAKFEDILADYDVCFTEVPPLEAGRFPTPLRINLNGADCLLEPVDG